MTPAFATTSAADTATVDYYSGATAIDVLANDTASDGETLDESTLFLCDNDQALETCDLTTFSNSAGSYSVSAGQISFTPARYFYGTATQVSYAVKDTALNVASSTLTVTVNAPTAASTANDSKAIVKNATTSSISVLANDTQGDEDFDSSTLAICLTSVSVASSCNSSTLEILNKGSFAISGSTVTFVPATDYLGSATVKYAVKDAAGQYANLSTVTFTTVGLPSAANNTSSGEINTDQTISPLNNDFVATNSAGVELDSTTLALCGAGETAPSCAQSSVEVSGKGTFTISSSSVVFSPITDFVGTASVGYQVADDLGQVANATITVTVNAASLDGTATDDTNSAAYDVTQTNIAVVTNDTPSAGKAFTLSSIKLCTGSEAADVRCTQTTLTVADVGTYTANSNGTITFNPLATFTGSNSVDYEVTDTKPLTVRATLTVTVGNPTAGTAVDDYAVVALNGSLTKDVLDNDTAGQAALDSVKLCATADATSGCNLDTLTIDGDGTYTVNLDGTIGFEPDTDVRGAMELVAYEAFDITGLSAGVATLSVIVSPGPIPYDDTKSALMGVTQTISPLANDLGSNIENAGYVGLVTSTLKLCGIGASLQTPPNCNKTSLAPVAGTVSVAAGVVTFDPTDVFQGDLVVYYQVADSLGQVASASITFTSYMVIEANDDTVSGDYNEEQTIDVLANDLPTTGETIDETTLKLCPLEGDLEDCTLDEVGIQNKGTFSISDSLRVVFTPLATFSGTVSLDYVVADTSDASATATVTVSIAAPAFPVLTADSSEDDFDVTQVVDVLANDTGTEADLNATTVKLCLTSTKSSCTLDSRLVRGVGRFSVDAENGEVTFDPSNSFWGDTSIYYTATDVTGQVANPVLIQFTVNQAADETINNDISAGRPRTVQTINVLANDNPGDSSFVATSLALCADDQLEADECDLTTYTTANGVYAVSAGKITFTPTNSFTGEHTKVARYTVEVTDGTRFGIAQIQVAVIAPTILADDEVEGDYDENLTLDVVSNDELSSLALRYEVGFDLSTIRLCASTEQVCALKKLVVPGVGIYTVDTVTGRVLFNPSATFASAAPEVTYQISDTVGNLSKASIAVTVLAPAAATLVNDTSFAKQGAKQTVSVLTNDVRGGAYLNPSKVRLCDTGEGDSDPCTLTSLTVSGQGTYVTKNDGTIEFTPLANAVGVMTAVRYQVADVTSQLTDPANLTISVIAKPTTVADTSSVAYNTAATKNVSTNDSIPAVGIANGVTLKAESVRLCGSRQTAPNCTATSLKVSGQGNYSVNTATGVITFTPLNTFAGAARAITYVIKDSLGQTSSSTYTVTVANPTASTATNDTGWSKFGAVQKFNLSANDTAGTAPLVAKSTRICLASETVASNCTRTSLTVANQGTYSVNTKNGQVSFAPAANFVGVATAIKYSVADLTGFRSTLGTLTVTVVGKPLAVDDEASSDYKQSATSNPTSNDSVSSLATSKGVTLQPSTIRLCAKGQSVGKCSATKVTVSGEGTYTLNTTTRVVTFTPIDTFAGETRGLKYQVSDSLGQAQTATLVATVGSPAPSILVDDSAIAAVAISKVISVLDNDLSVGAPITKGSVKLCSPTQLEPADCNLLSLTVTGEGTYSVNTKTGAITFKSAADFSGETSPITYTVTDITGQRASMAAISVTVVDGPDTTNDSSSAAYDVTQSIAVLDNDEMSDLEEANSIDIVADSLRICAVGKSAPNCTLRNLVVAGKGTFTVDLETYEVSFNPLDTFTGVATVAYQVADELGNISGAQASFTVGSPTLGTLTNDTQNVVQSVKTNIDVLLNDTRGGAPFKLTTVRLCGTTELTGAACSQLSLTVAGEGTYRVDTATGKISFTSVAGFTGPATFVRYTVADITGQKAVPARITLTVNAVP